MLPLLFALYFDRVVEYNASHTHPQDSMQVANLRMHTGLYADDLIHAASDPPSTQRLLTSTACFAKSESLRISKDKTLIL